jgi:DNA-directed RNA polymerase specialized sigma24 family protein
MAPADQLAARTLLQEFLGGLVNLARRVGRDADAIDDIVGLAWERIRTYPVHRPGSVSGNVLLDVRKRYCREQERAERTLVTIDQAIAERSAEDLVLDNTCLEELVAAGEASGVSNEVLSTIIRSRVNGESMSDLAAEQQVSPKVLWHRRWRAEARLRERAMSA